LAEHEHVTNLVVLAHGSLVAAHALRDRRVDAPAEVFSVTKSVLGTVTLLAVQEGRLTLDTTLGELLGERVPVERRVARVRDLLSMTGGARCGGLEDIDRVMELPGGWVDALLAEPQEHPPGKVFRYDNGATHLLSAGLREVVGDLVEYAAGRVFAEAGIEAFEWPADPDGVRWGMGGFGCPQRIWPRWARRGAPMCWAWGRCWPRPPPRTRRVAIRSGCHTAGCSGSTKSLAGGRFWQRAGPGSTSWWCQTPS
jgi:CubicO group peptidase (beta-lactamase class C family)